MFETGSIFALVLEGSWVTYVILSLLVIMSVISWGIIGFKTFRLKMAIKESIQFSRNFFREKTMADAVSLVNRFPYACTGLQFKMVHKEFAKIHAKVQKKNEFDYKDREDMTLRIERVIEKSILGIRSDLEKGLHILATISSSAPFIGLLGTVIGIIDSFHNIGSTGVTTLAVVAPGISEALVATGLGLFAAIPALMGYNYCKSLITVLTNKLTIFGLDLINKFNWIV